MKYNVNKDNYASLLWNRPTLIKKITSLDEDTAAFFVKAARRCYEYLPYELQASVKVVRVYIDSVTPEKTNYSSGVNLELIPQHALEQLDTKERIVLIRNSNNGAMINNFREPCYKEWLEAVKVGFDPMSVPEKFHNRKTLYVAAAYNYKSGYLLPNFIIPGVFWENDSETASKSLIEMIQVCPQMIDCIPPQRITNAHLVTAFQTKDYSLGFNEDRWLEIPLCSWNHATVQMALTTDATSIRIVPERYLTEADAIKCAKNKNVSEENIPTSLHTRRVLVSLAATNKNFPVSSYGGLPADLSFQLDVIKEGGFDSATALYEYIERNNYTKILNICPEFIQLIPKLEQTEAVIDVILGAPAEVIDKIAENINLGKIKKHRAPLLIGCENPIIISTIEKKLKGVHKGIKRKTPHSVEIDMAPGDYACIRNSLERQV
jgi:hypothetical protein